MYKLYEMELASLDDKHTHTHTLYYVRMFLHERKLICSRSGCGSKVLVLLARNKLEVFLPWAFAA